MVNHYIAVQSFVHKIDCFCPGKEHSDKIKVSQGDIISFQYERTYNMVNGWYVLVQVNHSSFHIAVEDLTHYYLQGLFYTETDLELQINYLNFCVNKALDLNDEGKFKEAAEKWIEVKEYREKLAAAADSNMKVSL
ncbi:hypothetical protein FZC79_21480 [Rossellomorea vietnamensis]|uniref:IDEAL domain-containing protein n=1 Tax=Rossellomorea vietnamensis TaxID=218284 RepID=A0A5D4K672_9BACI|nr:hypothetical protein [Rossellomorea vietnamensis]TYR72804.1 hypothetical protein FZC79_21480 [Rossellomorea vietnamensis]